MQKALIIIAGVVAAGGLGLWLNTGAGEDNRLQQMVDAVPMMDQDEDTQSETPSGVCSMDPRYRPRPGQGSCSATP